MSLHRINKMTFVAGMVFLSSSFLFGENIAKPQEGEDDNGRWIRDYYHYNTESIARLDAEIDFGMGELILSANPRGQMIEGSIRYYQQFATPEVDYFEIGDHAQFEIDLESAGHNGFSITWDEFKSFRNSSKNHFNNELEFFFPIEVETELNLDFGMGDAHVDFTGLTLLEVDLDCGMSNVQLTMDTANPISCRYLHIDSGLGAFSFSGLGNLRAKEIDIDVGLGSADIDLRGRVLNDIELDVDVGLGSMEITLPKSVNIKAKINYSFLSTVDVDDLVKKGDSYLSVDWNDDRPTVELDVSVGLGSVDIDLRD